MKLLTIIGARPQFIKEAPLSAELRKEHEEVLVHTGQHYDANMSDVFFEELGIPKPDYSLGIGGGTHGEQTGRMLEAVEKVMIETRPDAAIIYGDTNSTVAGALAAAKLHIPVAHIEAGLRSFNRGMPEEVNRVVADHLSTWCFCPSNNAVKQLASEGVINNVYDVGDIMADSVRMFAPKARAQSNILEVIGVEAKRFVLATCHRPVNTDSEENLKTILGAFSAMPLPVVLPLHPRTKGAIERYDLMGWLLSQKNVCISKPLGYLDMLQLQQNAALIVTDSGGVQKEAYYCQVPCLTLRDETEWVETVVVKWNSLCQIDKDMIISKAKCLLSFEVMPDHPNIYGDGFSCQKIVDKLKF